MNKVRPYIDRVLEILLVVLMGVLVIDVLWQVATRYLLGNPSAFTDELAGFLLIWVGLFGGAYATGKKQHLAIDLLPQRIAPQKKPYLYFFINLLIGLFALLVLIIGGGRLVYLTYTLHQTSSALELPLALVYLVLPLSGLLIIYYSICEMILNVQQISENKQTETA